MQFGLRGQQLEKCRKITIAGLCQIRVLRVAEKREIKKAVMKYTVENGILPEEGELAVVANPKLSSMGEEAEQTKPKEPFSIDTAELLSPRDPLLTI